MSYQNGIKTNKRLIKKIDMVLSNIPEQTNDSEIKGQIEIAKIFMRSSKENLYKAINHFEKAKDLKEEAKDET